MSRRKRSHQVTIREGTSEKYWYTLAAYLAVFGIFVAYFAYMVITISEAQSSTALVAGSFVLALGLLLLMILALGVYPALFKDSAYVRGSNYRWKPKWWYHISAGFGIPLVVALLGSTADVGSGAALGITIFPLTTAAIATHYLYRRHEHVGVP